MMRALTVLSCLASLLALGAAAPQATPDPEVISGTRQVAEGDYEGAVVTLRVAIDRLSVEPDSSRDLARAHLYLGVAHAALDERDAARAAFRGALTHDPDLRLTTEDYSPKVVRLFEDVRQELLGQAGGGGGGRPALLIGIGAAAAGGIAIATGRGDGTDTGGTVSASFERARFGTPMIVCPDGSVGVPILFTVLIDGRNTGTRAVAVQSVSTTMTIVDSSNPSEVGVTGTQPSTAAPSSLVTGFAGPVQVQSSLICDNVGGDPRFNEWQGRVMLTTSAGVFNLETADELRVDIP